MGEPRADNNEQNGDTWLMRIENLNIDIRVNTYVGDDMSMIRG